MKHKATLFAFVILLSATTILARKCPRKYKDDNAPRCIAQDKVSDIESQRQCHAAPHCCVGKNGVCYAIAKRVENSDETAKSDEQMAADAKAILSTYQPRQIISSRSLSFTPFAPVLLPYGGEEPYPGFSKPPEFVCQARPTFPQLCDVTKTKTVQYVRNPPLNIPYCQRIPCNKDKPELDARQSDCADTPGCFFDRSLADYRKRFGHSIMPGVPVCHLAIRNEVFLTEARKVKTKTGKWSAFLNQCLLETFNQVIRTPKEGCRLLKMLEYFKHKPKIAGWTGITDYECVLIDGCWMENAGCFYPVNIDKLSIQSSPTTQTKMAGALYYGRPRCQIFNQTSPRSSIESYHTCLISGCRLDQQAQDSYYNYLYEFGRSMTASDHWVFWRMVESGKYGAHNLHEYNPMPKQDVTVTPFSLVISYADNSSENSLLNELQQKGSGSLLETIKSLSGLKLPPGQQVSSDPFFDQLQSIQTPCSQTFTSFGGRPCGPPELKPVATPEHCPYQKIKASNLKPLQGSTAGCCDVTFCYHNKNDIIGARSGSTSYYSIWSYWTECSTTCGPGTKSRKRSCVGIDQSICKGNTTQEEPCQVAPCTQWGSWGQWSICPVTCNTGLQTRTRSCIPSGGFCPGKGEEVRQCGVGFCLFQNAVYGPWSLWEGSCSPCGTTSSRRRRCISGECDPKKLVERRICTTQCGATASSDWRRYSSCIPKFQSNSCHELWVRTCRDESGAQTRCPPGNNFQYRDCPCFT